MTTKSPAVFRKHTNGYVTVSMNGTLRYTFNPEYEKVRLVRTKTTEAYGLMISFKNSYKATDIIWLN